MKYLEKLARVFQNNKTRLYVVGSFVRKIVSGDKALDVDLCGEFTPTQVEKILKDSEFEVFDLKNEFFRVKIRAKLNSKVIFDYTTFRKDVYALNGGHHPIKIENVKLSSIDYKRRDFTINAIYFDPLTKEYLDYCGGLIDLKHRLLKTILEPNICFSSDALRIVRMVRFAVDGPFNIEYNTFVAAKNQAQKIDKISSNKFMSEYKKIQNIELANKLLKEIFPWKKF